MLPNSTTVPGSTEHGAHTRLGRATLGIKGGTSRHMCRVLIHTSTGDASLPNEVRKVSHTLSWVEYSEGPSHQAKWTVICKVSRDVKDTGVADSKVAAKDEAERQALVAYGF
ncbi:hypothetical protein C8R44DRAFT_733316 [Mycena epipterygia]|nr:hypothetical protein C8R44DRAFT_733316 [Mycena epipterygia]